MKKIYSLTTSMMNGTVTMASQTVSFSTMELAEKAKQAVDEANKDSEFPVYSTIDESWLYETEEDVPILNR